MHMMHSHHIKAPQSLISLPKPAGPAGISRKPRSPVCKTCSTKRGCMATKDS